MGATAGSQFGAKSCSNSINNNGTDGFKLANEIGRRKLFQSPRQSPKKEVGSSGSSGNSSGDKQKNDF
jgi:hypothetical protein